MPVDPTTTVGIIAALVAFIGVLGRLHLSDDADVRKKRDEADARADRLVDVGREQVAATNNLADEFVAVHAALKEQQAETRQLRLYIERLRADLKPRSR